MPRPSPTRRSPPASWSRWRDGILVAPYERGESGPDLFLAARRMGLEGLVSKRRDRPYQAGRSRHRKQSTERVLQTFG
jgi:bifunctional non-homologous end joining protein LigD